MQTVITILTGIASSGKTERLLDGYRRALQIKDEHAKPGGTLWLTPSLRSRKQILNLLQTDALPVCFAPNIFTFEQFAKAILAHSFEERLQIHDVARRFLIRNIIREQNKAGALKHFSSIAQTAGFLDLVSAFISEMKREEIWPEHFSAACEERNANQPVDQATQQKDRELSAIYQEYQNRLRAYHWYDREGRFWLARDLMEKEQTIKPFAQLELVVVDGFTDFTRTQYEILELIAGHATQMIIALPGESADKDSELFAKTVVAHNRFRQFKNKNCSVTFESMRSTNRDSLPAFRQIAEHLFENPRTVTQLNDATGLLVIAASGERSELETIAGKIKQQLLAGIGAEEIVLTLRDVASRATLLEDIFQSSGIPFCLSAPLPLAQQPVIKALLSILDCELQDWRFETLMKVLHSSWFQPDWEEYQPEVGDVVSDVSSILRTFKLHTGRKTILNTLQRRVNTLQTKSETESTENFTDTLPQSYSQLTSACNLLNRLEKETQQLRKKHRFTDWCDILRLLARSTGITPHSEMPTEAADLQLQQRDQAVWKVFDGLLSEASTTDDILGESAPRQTLSEFIEALRDILQTEAISAARDETGRVQILDVSEVRNLEIPHLYFAGLTESSFPQTRQDDCITNNTERQQLNSYGLPIRQKSTSSSDEMLYFYGIVTRARQSLTLSYSAVSSNGQPLFSSPYVTALCGLFTTDALSITHAGQLDPVPSMDQILTSADLRIVATSELHNDNPELFRSMAEDSQTSSVAHNILAATDMAVARFKEKGFTPYEGELAATNNIEYLQGYYDADYQFSTTKFENYSNCAFKYFMHDVLKLAALESPETATDHRTRGNLVHEVLARLHTEFTETNCNEAQSEELASRFQEILEEITAQHYDNTDLQKALSSLENELLSEWADIYGEHFEAYATLMETVWGDSGKIVQREVPFGDVPGEETDEASISHPPLSFGSKENHIYVRGKIDRVDVGEQDERRLFNVIDYKSGRASQFNMEDVQSGKAIQLVLYTLAVCRLNLAGDDAQPHQPGYWQLKEKGFITGFKQGRKKKDQQESLNVDVLKSLEVILDGLLPRIANDIRSGKFPVDNRDDKCATYCDYSTICRVNQLRRVAERLDKVREINH